MTNSLTLTFHFLGGAYVGRDYQGNMERFPSPLRLHAALLNAAGRGSTAVPGARAFTPRGAVDIAGSSHTSPSPAARAALAWMENHPPTKIVLPDFLGADPEGGTLYIRRDRMREKKYQLPDKQKLALGQPVNGPLVYAWDEVPAEHVDILSTLTREVGYLGESVSVVVGDAHTRTGIEYPADRTLVRDESAMWSEPGVIRLDTPAPGRTQGLIDAFENHYRASLVNAVVGSGNELGVSADSPDGKGVYAQDTASDQARKALRQTVVYRYSDPAVAPTVWDTVYLVPVVEELSPDEYVEVAVRLHRALVRALPVPLPVVTGTFPSGTVATANHLAIQPVPRSLVDHLGRVGEEYGSVILVMLPSEIAPAEKEMIASALNKITGRASLYASHRDQIKPGVPDLNIGPIPAPVASGEFWPASDTGEREWITYPLAVAETSGKCTGTEAVQVSMSLVQRDRINVADGPGRIKVPNLRGALIRAARDADTTVEGFRVVETTPSPYLHKFPKGLTVRLYQAKIKSRFLGDRELSAIGQTRHLGGGLLIPADLP